MPATTAPHRHGQTLPDPAPAAAPTPRRRPIARSDEQQVLSIRERVPHKDAQQFIADALHDIRIFMQEHDLSPAGPPFSICRPRRNDVDIEAGWPTATKPLPATSRIHSCSLPRSLTGPRATPNVDDAVERGGYVLEARRGIDL